MGSGRCPILCSCAGCVHASAVLIAVAGRPQSSTRRSGVVGFGCSGHTSDLVCYLSSMGPAPILVRAVYSLDQPVASASVEVVVGLAVDTWVLFR